jgi:hypothetical protein
MTPGSSRHQAKLENPAGSECQHNHRSEDHGEQQRYREWQMPVEDGEVHLYALQVLQDEDENDDQRDDANDQRRPRSTEAGLALARVRLPRLCIVS